MNRHEGPAHGHGGSPSIEVPDYWWYVARADLLETALRSHVQGAGLTLDLGSADGPSASWLRDAVARTVSLDIDPRGLGSDGVCGSALALPFADETFEAVSAFDVIEHCDPESQALAEVRRVLKPGGRFVMSVPAYTWAWSDFDVANGRLQRSTCHPRLRLRLPDVRGRTGGAKGAPERCAGCRRRRRGAVCTQAAQRRAVGDVTVGPAHPLPC